MGVLESIFWTSLIIVLYTYIGYAVLLYVFLLFKRFFAPAGTIEEPLTLPAVSLIVPAYNEGSILQQKIENCLALSYPADKLNVIFVTDGTTDGSEQMVSAVAKIKLLHQPEREGKMAALNRAVTYVQTPIVLFSDANTLLNPDCVLQVAQHYHDPRVGGVAGEKKIHSSTHSSIGLGEGLYWKYELALKQLDAGVNTVVGAAGELFSMRTNLFVAQPTDTLLDDFMLWAHIVRLGYKVTYEPSAFATEEPSKNLVEEGKRRVRIAAGAFQSLFRLVGLLNVFRAPLLAFQYFSRRVCRWLLCPPAIIMLFISNAVLYQIHGGWLYKCFFIVQCALYLLALLGWMTYRKNVRITLLFIPFYFVFMHACLVQGFINYVTNRQSVLWQKSKRHG